MKGNLLLLKDYIRTLNNKSYKYMISIPKILYIDKLDNIVNEYNNTYHRNFKMKPIDVTSSIYIDVDVENNNRDLKPEVGGQCKNVRLQKHCCKRLHSKLV